MATINGMTAEKMQEVLDSTIESATISGSSLTFTRADGSTFSAGNFNTYINAQITPAIDAAMADVTTALGTIPGQVSTAVASAVPTAVAGGVTAKGNVTGNVTFTPLTAAQMVNRIITATLTGNITIDKANFPSSPIPGTQFAMVLKQDATGNRTLTLVNILKSQGVLTLSTAANARDVIMFFYDGTDWYAGAMGVAFS